MEMFINEILVTVTMKKFFFNICPSEHVRHFFFSILFFSFFQITFFIL